jgi:hypothetical protein
VTGSGAKKPPAAPRKRKKRAGPVSLHPLSFDDAMRALLQVKPLKGGGENPERGQAEPKATSDGPDGSGATRPEEE